MAVYGLSYARSRELYDLRMFEIRRLLYNDVKRRSAIVPGQLFSTRCAWMTRYTPLLSAVEFTKFVVLMRNLAPYLLFTIDPQSRGHRQDRNPPIGRKNLELILDGHPARGQKSRNRGRGELACDLVVLSTPYRRLQAAPTLIGL